jgi:hypothetical protein
MLAHFEGLDGDNGMRVVRGAHDDGVDAGFIIEEAPKILISGRFRKASVCFGGAFVIYIRQRNDVFTTHFLQVHAPHSPRADPGDVEGITRRTKAGAPENVPWQYHDGGCRRKEISSIHSKGRYMCRGRPGIGGKSDGQSTFLTTGSQSEVRLDSFREGKVDYRRERFFASAPALRLHAQTGF